MNFYNELFFQTLELKFELFRQSFYPQNYMKIAWQAFFPYYEIAR